ncbi:MAG: hypothetical protein K2X47_10625, partial [Bdellovibrionales bacterium]|nr:hypothetical protein [Bdellovibrionales bacterium]
DSANFTYTTATGAMTIGGTAPSITSNDEITIAAGGTNKNVVLTPSGTGYTLLNGNVGIGTSFPTTKLHLGVAPTASSTSALLQLTNTFSGGHANGQHLGIDAAAGFTGNLATFNMNGSPVFEVRTDRITVGANTAGSSSSLFAVYTSGGTIDVLNGKTLSAVSDRFNLVPTSLNLSSGYSSMLNISLPDATSGTGGFAGIKVNKTGSGTGSGVKSLIDLQIAGASALRVDATTGNVGIGTSSAVDTLSIGTAPAASATRALVNLSSTALSGGSANGSYIGANPAAFAGNFIDLQVAGVRQFSVSSTGVITGNGSALTGVPGTLSGLTSGRVALTTGSNAIGDDANLTYASGQLNVTGTSAKARINNVYIGNSGASSLHGASGSGGLLNLQNIVSDSFSFTSYLNTTASNVFVMNARPAGSTENLLQIQKAGTGVLTVDNSGNLGIGTTSPSQKLEVNGDALLTGGGAGTLYLSNASHGIGYNGGPGVNLFSNHPSSYLTFSTNSGERMRITQAGNVGIGTTTPTRRLEVPWVSGDTTMTAYFGSSNAANNQMAIRGQSFSSTGVSGISNSGYGGFFSSFSGAGIYSQSSTSNGVDGLTTDAGGGAAGVLGRASGFGYGGKFTSAYAASGFFQTSTTDGSNTDPTVIIQANTSQTANLLEFRNSAAAQLTVINSLGNVGIGTATPAAKLDVAGTAKLGTNGTAITGMGACSMTGKVFNAAYANYTCNGIPASTAVVVNCSPDDTPDDYAVWACRATGTANQIECHTPSGITTGLLNWTCMWLQI